MCVDFIIFCFVCDFVIIVEFIVCVVVSVVVNCDDAT